MDTQDDIRKPKNKAEHKPAKKPSRFSWPIRVFFISICLSAALSVISSELLGAASLAASFAILAGFIGLGILFDIIGVAVTAADEKPFHSMAEGPTRSPASAMTWWAISVASSVVLPRR